MMNKTSLGLLAIALASGACSTSSSDDIWFPPGSDGGKADGFTTIRGKDIPSAYVDANKYYMIARNIANLTTVGALDADETSLAKRVDGIIANLPADGKMELAELVRMEDPTIHSSLFPGEKAALPKVWKMMEAPDSNDVLYGPRDNFGVVDASIAPTAAVPPASLAISTLSTDLQAPATRLENVYDSDNDATTVTLADLASGVANPASFTQAEETAFASIQAVFRTKAVAQASPQLIVSPGPGSSSWSGTLGPTSFQVTGATKIAEERVVNGSSLTTTLTATQALAATVSLPMGAQVLVVSQDTGNESVFGAGAVPSLPGGNYIFEMWQSGQRAYATNAELPVMTSTTPIALNDKLDYTITSGVAPLVRNLTNATVASQGYYYNTIYTVDYTYDTTAMPAPAGADQRAVTATATPNVTIPVGRYSFPQSNAKLYVYSNNVLWFSIGSATYRMLPIGNNGAAPTQFSNTSGLSLTFDTSTNTLYCGSCSPAVSQRLDGSMRDI